MKNASSSCNSFCTDKNKGNNISQVKIKRVEKGSKEKMTQESFGDGDGASFSLFVNGVFLKKAIFLLCSIIQQTNAAWVIM